MANQRMDLPTSLYVNGSPVGAGSYWLGTPTTGTFDIMPSGGLNLNFSGAGSIADVRSISLRTGNSGTHIVNQTGCLVIGDALQIQSGYSFFMGYNIITGSKNYQLCIGSGGALVSNYGYSIGNANNIRTDYAFAHGSSNVMSQDFATAYNVMFGSGNSQIASGGSYNFLQGNANTVTTTGNNYMVVHGSGNVGVRGNYSYLFGSGHVMGAGTYRMVFGETNTVAGTWSAVFGKSHNINCDGAVVGGNGNTIAPNSQNSVVFGGANAVTGGGAGYNAIVGGTGNSVNKSCNVAGGQTNTINGDNSTVFGYNNAVTGDGCISAGYGNITAGLHNAVFGQTNDTDQSWSFMAGFGNVIRNGAYNAVMGHGHFSGGTGQAFFGYGHNNQFSPGFYNFAAGYQNQLNAASYNGVVGYQNTVNGAYSFVSGQSCTSGAGYGLVTGFHAKSTMMGQTAQASGYFAADGDAQASVVTVRMQTADDTPTELALDGSGTYITTEDNKAYAYVATIVAKESGSTNHAMYKLEWTTVRGSGVATVTVDGKVKTVIYEDNVAWDIDVTADTTNGRPAIKVTGVAATNIRWVAKLEITEVGY